MRLVTVVRRAFDGGDYVETRSLQVGDTESLTLALQAYIRIHE